MLNAKTITTPSPFDGVIGTNFIPTRAQIPIIRQIVIENERRLKATEVELFISRSIVANLEHELLRADNGVTGEALTPLDESSRTDRSSNLRQELSVVRTTVREIVDEQERLQKSILGHEPLLAPIRRVPPEVLSEIFIYCLPNERFANISFDEAPSLFGHVCRLWRHVSHNTARLWAEFNFEHLGRIPPPIAGSEGMKVWLARSASCPLSFKIFPDPLKYVKISEKDNGEASDKEKEKEREKAEVSRTMSFDAMMRTLCQHVYRWKSIDLELPALWTVMLLSSLSKGKGAPILETIRFVDTTDSAHRIIPVDLSSTPHLTTLEIRGSTPSHGISFKLGDIVSHRLRDLSIKGTSITFDQFLSVVHHCRFMTRCEVNLGRPNNGETLEPGCKVVIMPCLERMKLNMNSRVDPGMLLDKLQLPEIKDLAISMPECDKGSWPHVTQLLRRSGSQLESFYILGGAIMETDIIALLHTSPSLRSLTALGLPFSDAIMTKLTNKYGTTPVCPHLQIVSLSRCPALSAPSIVQMITSRCLAPAATSGLTKVTLWNCKAVGLENDLSIATCVEKGLELAVKDGYTWY